MSRRFVICLGLVLLWPALAVGQPGGELIERTLAIVAGQAITLSDVQTAIALRLVDERTVDAATQRLIDRTLMLREVQRYAPPEPSQEAIDAQLDAIRSRFESSDGLAEVLAAGGFTERRLRAWVRDDLRIAAYLEQRFAAAGTGSEELILDWIADLRRRATIVELWKQ